MLISNSHALNFDNLTILLEIVFTFFLWFHCMFEMSCFTPKCCLRAEANVVSNHCHHEGQSL